MLPSPHQVKLYDYIFYLSKNTKVNTELIKEKLIDSQVIKKEEKFNRDVLKDLLNKRFDQIDYKNAKEDIETFIEDKNSLDLWSKEFFKEIITNLMAD